MADKPPPLNIDSILPPSQDKEDLIKKCQYHWEQWLKAVSALNDMHMKEIGQSMVPPQMMQQPQHMPQGPPPGMQSMGQSQGGSGEFNNAMYPMFNFYQNWSGPGQKWSQ